MIWADFLCSCGLMIRESKWFSLYRLLCSLNSKLKPFCTAWSQRIKIKSCCGQQRVGSSDFQDKLQKYGVNIGFWKRRASTGEFHNPEIKVFSLNKFTAEIVENHKPVSSRCSCIIPVLFNDSNLLKTSDLAQNSLHYSLQGLQHMHRQHLQV